LLQTVDYARALAEADPALADDDARDKVVEATLARQKATLGERKPDIHVVIGEAAPAPKGRRLEGDGRASRPPRRGQR
jgi:Domain of unknown function (DUF5753)